MADTPQPAAAGETEVVSTQDAIKAAAEAFKTYSPDEPPDDDRPRDSQGRFISQAPTEAAEDQIEAEAEAEPAEEAAESQEAEAETEEAAEEAQPTEVALPASWPAEQAETWKNLPPEAQEFISKREGERDAAVNSKFQEAANLRKAHEAEINEANANRQRYAEAADLVLSLAVPPEPPVSMLDINSNDYDPDAYHYQKATRDQTIATLNQHKAQLAQIRAQEASGQFDAINNATRDGFIQSVPEVADQAKAPAIFTGLMEYAVSLGLPPETFNTPTTAIEWHVLWKAKEYDRLQSAKARVKDTPKPEPRKPQPAVRPGVTTPRSAIEQKNRQGALDRLAKEGTVQAGAQALKHLLKGQM